MKMEEYTREFMASSSFMAISGRRHICMMAIAVLFAACHPKPSDPPDYGVVYNPIRESIGLKPIPNGWTATTRNWPNRIYFVNPGIDSTLKEPKAYYAGKTLEIKNDSLIFESDQYVILRFPKPNLGVIIAQVTYIYRYFDSDDEIGWVYHYAINKYPSDTLPTSPWESTYRWELYTRRDSVGNWLPMTRAEADSILATWGMKYP